MGEPNLGLPWYADEDQREGMAWNIHIVEMNQPHMRICFMATSPDTRPQERAAFIIEACNNHDRLTRENEAMRKALEDCLGCVTAAEAEGLHEVVEELRGFSEQTDRLIDLVERRLIWVRNYAEPALSSLKESPDAKA